MSCDLRFIHLLIDVSRHIVILQILIKPLSIETYKQPRNQAL